MEFHEELVMFSLPEPTVATYTQSARASSDCHYPPTAKQPDTLSRMLDRTPKEKPRWTWLRILLIGIGAALLVFVITAFVALRWLNSQRICAGENARSPDGRYLAEIWDCSKKDFWTGEPHAWLDFTLAGPGIDYDLTSKPIDGLAVGRDGRNVIRWEPDSSAVRFDLGSGELRLSTSPAKP